MFILCVFTSSVTSLLMTLVFAARSGGGIAARVGGSGGGGGGRICEVPSFAMNVNEAIDVAQHWNFFLWKCAAFLAACGAQPEDARQSLQYALLPFQVDIPNAQYASSVKSQHLHGWTPITRASQRVHSIMVESIAMLAILSMLNSWKMGANWKC